MILSKTKFIQILYYEIFIFFFSQKQFENLKTMGIFHKSVIHRLSYKQKLKKKDWSKLMYLCAYPLI